MQLSSFCDSPDGLSRERWDFNLNGGLGGLSLTLVGHSIERRSKPKGRYRAAVTTERWSAYDERKYASGLPRPVEVPYERAVDALVGASVKINLGWNNDQSHQFDLKITGAE